MRASFAFGVGIGLVLLLASAAPGCNSSDSGTGGGGAGGTGGGGTGGGGTGGGGTGGAAGTDGAAGATSTLKCGSNTCTASWLIKGLVPVSGCCAGTAKDQCGAQIDSSLKPISGLPEGCYQLDQPGTEDCGCPTFTFTNPVPPPQPAEWNGCCHPDGTCGNYVDLSRSGLGGPKLGCIDATPLLPDGGTIQACTVGQAQPPVDAGGYVLCPLDGGTGGAAGSGGSDAASD